MDYGLSEHDFWNMTLAEVNRFAESQKRTILRNQQEKATFDYILADLVGRSVGRIYSSSAQMPPIAEVYPSLFESESIQEARREKQDELSVLRFKQFAQSFNKKFKEVGKD